MKPTEIVSNDNYDQLDRDIARCPYYFAYGMNTNSKNMIVRTETSVDLGRARLSNFRLEFKVYCDVVRSGSGHVDGVLWKMDAEGLDMLDVREGYPYYYNRAILPIASKAGITRAWVYYMTEKRGNNLRVPPLQYWQDVSSGYREHGIDIQQLRDARDRAVRAQRNKKQKGPREWTY
jgi:gamma-glutamylcyclotransferase (GGCT)/AIG2-like uncharacterized protein YtfP